LKTVLTRGWLALAALAFEKRLELAISKPAPDITSADESTFVALVAGMKAPHTPLWRVCVFDHFGSPFSHPAQAMNR